MGAFALIALLVVEAACAGAEVILAWAERDRDDR